MRATLNALLAAAQIFYMVVTPGVTWWLYGVMGLGVWLAVTSAWMGGSVVVWSAYQEWRDGKRNAARFLSSLLLSPLLGTLWTIAVIGLVVHYASSLALNSPSTEMVFDSSDHQTP